MPIQREHGIAILWATLVFFAVTLLRTAWVCDDAFITFRTLDNFFNGYGLVWNIAERVQTYTHPLWLFVLGVWSAITGDFYYTAIFLAIATTLLALCLYSFGICRNWSTALIGLFILLLSKAFVDYSTSGLENPLTHLVLAGLFWVYFRPSSNHRVYWISLFTALLALCRMDAVLFAIPVWISVLWLAKKERRIYRDVFLGWLPFLLWELFSLIYYGTLFPNTAYAKLNADIALSSRFEKGFFYFLNSIALDPITLPVIIIAILFPIVHAIQRTWFNNSTNGSNNDRVFGACPIPVVTGILLYLLYILYIGGDFMSGRFLTAPLFASVVLLSRSPLDHYSLPVKACVLGVVLLAGLSSPVSPIYSDLNYGRGRQQLFDVNQFTDERGVYFISLGMANRNLLLEYPDHPRAKEGLELRAHAPRVKVHGAVGMVAFYAGPQVHVVDYYALTDPFLARLPAIKNLLWRPGHLRRHIPKGYIETLQTGNNSIQQADLAKYYEIIKRITRGPIFNLERFHMILGMTFGRYEFLIDKQALRYPDMNHIQYQQINQPVKEGTPWNASNTLRLYAGGVRIELPERTNAPIIELTVDANDTYGMIFLDQNEELGEVLISPLQETTPGLDLRRIDVPESAQRDGYTHIHVMPFKGDQQYSIGHIRILEN